MGRKDNPISNTTDSLQARMRQARQAKNISLTGLAERTGFTKGYLSSIENGSGTPSEELIRAYERELELEQDSLISLLDGTPAPRGRRHRSSAASQKTYSEPGSSVKRKDIIATPIIRRLPGRRVELRQLQQWLTEDHCTLVSVLGMGGTGKTSLVAYLLNQLNNGTINHEFEYIAWYSLQDAPQLSHIIERFSNLFSDQIRSTKEEHPSVETLIELFGNHRCLLVLDDFESVFARNSSVGQYEEQYADYGKLLQRVGESNHQSCLLLISREKPKEIPRVEGETASVRSMELAGIMLIKEVKSFLEGEKLFGEDEDWEGLVKRYDGNPLALKLIASTIREMFAGEIATFLAQGETTFGDLSTFLDEQFERLSEDERTIFYWLAVERGSVSLDDLKKDVAPRLSGPELSAKLTSLRQRYLIVYQGPTRIALQPAILAYITNKLIQDICDEILKKTLRLLASHALVKAQAEDYVRNDQIRHILLPIRDYLVQLLGRDGVEQLLKEILDDLQKSADTRKKTGYTAGNILNLLVYLKGSLSGFDFSHLTIRQSYLQHAALHDVDFSYSDLSTSVFAENFRGITSLSLNTHSKVLAAGTITGEIWIWDASSGFLKPMHGGDASWVCWSVSFSPDGQLLASGSEDNVVRLWDVQRGILLQELRGHTGSVSSVAFSPDSKLLASGSEDKCTIVWDVSNPKAAKHFRTLRDHQEKIWAVAFHPYVDEMMLATGSDDGVIILWNAATGEKLWTLTEKPSVYNEAVYALAFSPNGKWLASGGKDCTVRLWDVDTGELHKMLGRHDDWVWSVAFSRDSDTIASGSEDKSVRTWDVKSGKLLHILSGHTGSVWAIAFDTQHDIFVSGGIDRSIRFWNVQRGVCLRVLQGYMNGIRSIAYNASKRLLASVGEDYNVYLWQSDHEHETHDPYTPYDYKTLVGHTNVIWAAAFHPDGQLLVTGGDDKTIRFWDTHTGMLLDTRQEHDVWIRTLAFSPDGERFASGGDGNIHIWNTRHRTHTAQLPGHKAPVRAIAFHPDNTLLASGSDDGTLYLRQLDGSQRTELRRQEQSSLVLPAHELGIWSLAFSHDGKLLASGSEDQTIRLWDAHSGRYMNTFEGDISWIGALAFHPTQHILASGGGDNLVRLWDIKTGRVVTTLQGHSGPVSSLAFIIEDGSTLASGSHDGTIIIWDTQTGKLIQRLQADRPYERMNISHVAGLNDAQIRMLNALGAVEEELQ